MYIQTVIQASKPACPNVYRPSFLLAAGRHFLPSSNLPGPWISTLWLKI